MECIRLRVHDLDFERNLIYLRGAKGGKDRTTIFPKSINTAMKEQIKLVKSYHDQDLAQGLGVFAYLVKSIYPVRSPANTKMPAGYLGGSMFFLQRKPQSTRVPVKDAVITYLNRACKKL